LIIYWPSSGIGEWDLTRNGNWSPDEVGSGTKMINPPDDDNHDEPALYDDWQDLMIVDLNGDGLSDIVYVPVGSDRMVYWLNTDSITLDGPHKLDQLPYRREYTTVIPADMNGNGCIDILWNYPADNDSNNVWQYLELFPDEKPYLLKTASNGIGRKIIFHYSSSTQEFVRDQTSQPWKSGVPNATHVLSRFDIQDGMGQTYSTNFAYHNGYYDGREKTFRGFGKVEQIEKGDTTAPALITEYSYHTGQYHEALKGKTQGIITQTSDKKIFYQEYFQWQTKTLFVDPDNSQRKVTFPYQNSKTRNILEKNSGDPVELKWEYEHDNFGNIIKLIEFGRMDSGWDDERITVNTWSSAYTSGEAAWILNKLVDKKVTDENQTMVSHQMLFYDGNDIQGIIQKGNLTKVKNWIAENTYITSIRNEYDDYGNIIAAYDPLYGTQPGHYRRFTYDELFQTYPINETIYTGKQKPETLNLSATYNYGTGKVVTSTDFNGFITYYAYDAFGRLTSITKPYDSEHTIQYEYILNQRSGDKILNWIETRQRDNSQGDGFYCSRTYFDGLGRKIMTRTEGENPGQIVVSDTIIFNARQKPWKTYLPYFETDATLNYTDPTYHTGYIEHFYDALGRIIQENQPANENDAVFSKITYEPLIKIVQDEEQTREQSIHSGCSMKYFTDGLLDKDGNGRLRQVHEIVKLSDKGELLNNSVNWLTTYSYNLNDLVTGYCDSQNNKKFISYDGHGRKTWMNDPDRGQIYYTYDDAGNLIQTIDAKNQIIKYEYDGINRMIAEYHNTNDLNPDVEYHYDLPSQPLDKGSYFQNTLSHIIAHAILFNQEYRQDYDLNNDQQIDVSDVVKASRENIMNTGGLTQADNTKGYLAWVKDQSGETHFSYDGRGRIKWTIRRIQSEKHQAKRNFYTENQYDSMDRITKLIYPDATSIQYKYNNRAMLESIPGVINQLDYNPEGQNALLSLSCGVQTTYEYDHRLRLQKLISIRKTDSLNLQNLDYTYDEVSNIVQINDNREISTFKKIGNELGISDEKSQFFNATQSFEYDSLYRLTQASNQDVYGTIHYRYDRIGNMISKKAEISQTDALMDLGVINSGGNMGTWNRVGRNAGDDPGPHAITDTEKGMTDGLLFTYDDNGNMINNRGMTLRWDVKDRLVGLSNTGINAKYTYDYSGSRKSKVVIDSEENKTEVLYIDKYSEIRDNQLRKYVYAGMNRIARMDGLGTTYQFYLHDHLGSVNFVVADDGEVFSQIVNYPFGKERFGVEKKTADYRFTGKERDSESGLHYFEARYYEKIIGIFIGVDPLSENIKSIDQLNSYRYCDNSPINNIDQDGKDTYSLQISLTGVIGSGGNLSFGWVMDDKWNIGWKVDASLRGGAEIGGAIMFGYSQKDTIRDLTDHGANVSADAWIFGTTVPLNHIDEDPLKKGELQAGLGLGWPLGASIGYGVTGVLPLFNVKKPIDFIRNFVQLEYDLAKSMYNQIKDIDFDVNADSFINIMSEMGGPIYNHGKNVTIAD
jgi:RHS repeat-associated protein